jgi:hypothetical protein
MPLPSVRPATALFAGFPPPVPPAVEPEIRIRRYAPRRNRGFDWESLASLVGVVVLLGVGGLLVGMFVNQSTSDLVFGRAKAKLPPIVRPDPIDVPEGGGKANDRMRQTVNQPERAKPVMAQLVRQAQGADQHLRDAIDSARKGFFDAAELSVGKALSAVPGDKRAEGMRLVIAYLKQYPTLADDALAGLNQNDTEIDLGGRYGQAAYVDRAGDTLTLRVGGMNKKFTTNDINGIPGARFRITRDFLDRASNPVNDLILGARIFVSQQDDRGRVDPQRSRTMAEDRWRKAAISDKPKAVEDANLMLNVLDIK